ncbi:UNVERIFIED_CONTAM: LEAF RUST 10 DISEASE-RESISTANCE LOCUS RECEPTOR-LIKE PROTEIN KINASE-like 2.1 [Sesamum calycinum]|uniref:LEAF RUST 10 DISEASE-RESISTANCE LOCUS RECEPTOR-LIKE PROTEIN KINASE-like 2.1 n=1 Tax=Sesamum calycinum TaxID=2727403 RepID=A0AAW2SV04_9LAMI
MWLIDFSVCSLSICLSENAYQTQPGTVSHPPGIGNPFTTPGSYSQQDMCSDSFQCANITNITYPFWGGSQPQACGLRGFKLLNCDGHFPLLYISPLMYRVLEFDFSNQTLKVARQDLLGDACPTTLYNTILQDPYHFAPDSNDLNITLFFNCFIDKNGKRTKIVNQFGCSILFGAGDASSSPGPNITCSHNISVPVNQTAMQALENRYGSDVLREAVARGFFINYISRPERAAAPSPVYQEGPRATEIIGKSVVLVALTICTASVIICCCLLKRRLAARRNPNNERVEKFLLQHGSLALKRYKYSEIKKMTKSFNDKLGRGGYGSVYRGVLPDGCPVAVKILIDSDSDSNGEEFINEVASISRTSHVNIVNLLGFCYGGNKRALVYEFMPNKSLDKFINDDFCPKISDFGLAKLCKKKQSILSVLGTRGTIGYIAPEVFSRNYGGVSHKSDVYSYGMMVLEMAGAKKIVDAEATHSSENYFPDGIYEQVVVNVSMNSNMLMIEEEEETTRKMFLVGFWCIQTNPSDRPRMSMVVEMLEGSVQSISIPPKPVLFTPTFPISGPEFSSTLSAYVETENSAEV